MTYYKIVNIDNGSIWFCEQMSFDSFELLEQNFDVFECKDDKEVLYLTKRFVRYPEITKRFGSYDLFGPLDMENPQRPTSHPKLPQGLKSSYAIWGVPKSQYKCIILLVDCVVKFKLQTNNGPRRMPDGVEV